MELNIYEVEFRTGKRGKYGYLITSEGNLFAWDTNFKDLDILSTYKGKCVEATISRGNYPSLYCVDKIIGEAKKMKGDRNDTITRIACVNSAIKLLDLKEKNEEDIDKLKKIVLGTATELYEFVTAV